MSRSSSPSKSLTDKEHSWRIRLREAQTRYWHALDRHQETVEKLDRCLENGAPYERARAKHDVAFQELIRRQKILTGLVLRKNMPPSPLARAKH